MERAVQAVGSICSDHVNIMLSHSLAHSFIKYFGPFDLLWMLVMMDTNMRKTKSLKKLIVKTKPGNSLEVQW